MTLPATAPAPTANVDVFAPFTMAGVNFRNRIIRSATDEAAGDAQGYPTDRLSKTYSRLAKGGVGGIITGYMSVSADGETAIPGMVMFESDARIPKLAQVVEEVHATGTPIVAQIAHCGAEGVAGKAFKIDRLSSDTIERVIDDYVAAAIRAKKTGYDAVELHLAHGYFLSQMLSPHTNHRRDQWGGSTEKRFHIVEEIMRGIRKALPDYPVFAKVNGDESPKDGIHAEEAVRIARLLEQTGVNAIEVSCAIDFKAMGPGKGNVPADMVLWGYPGMKDLPAFAKKLARPMIPKFMQSTEAKPKFNVPAAKKIKAAVDVPVFVVGGIHDLADVRSTICEDGLDAVSMSRPLIVEPGLVNKFKSGKGETSRCLSCNHCFIGLYAGQMRCYYGKVPQN